MAGDDHGCSMPGAPPRMGIAAGRDKAGREHPIGQRVDLDDQLPTRSGCEVCAHGLVPLGKRIAHQSAETLKRGVIDPVTGEKTVPPARDEALLEEQGQVFAGIGL